LHHAWFRISCFSLHFRVADIDTTGTIASGNGNLIFLRETFNTSITSRFSSEINSLYLSNFNIVGLSTFNCTSVVVATWLRVGHYNKITTTLSTFQLVMGLSNVSIQQNFTFVMFHYNCMLGFRIIFRLFWNTILYSLFLQSSSLGENFECFCSCRIKTLQFISICYNICLRVTRKWNSTSEFNMTLNNSLLTLSFI
jgi:hypothetical protein